MLETLEPLKYQLKELSGKESAEQLILTLDPSVATLGPLTVVIFGPSLKKKELEKNYFCFNNFIV